MLDNLPARPVAWLLRRIAFPLGRWRRASSDRLGHLCAALLIAPSATRDRLTSGIYVSKNAQDATGRIEAAFAAAVERDTWDEKLRAALGKGARAALAHPEEAVKAKVLTREQADALARANAIIRDAINVDDFAPEELTPRQSMTPAAAA